MCFFEAKYSIGHTLGTLRWVDVLNNERVDHGGVDECTIYYDRVTSDVSMSLTHLAKYVRKKLLISGFFIFLTPFIEIKPYNLAYFSQSMHHLSEF